MEVLENHIWFVVWIGAVMSHWFSGGNGSVAARAYLKKLIPKLKDNHCHIIDLLISPALGALFAFITIGPTEIVAAAISGATWHLALNKLIDLKGIE